MPYLYKRRHAGASLAAEAPDIGHLPAAEIENAVLAQIHVVLAAPEVLIATWRACQRHAEGADLDEAQVVLAMQRIGAVWEQLFPIEQQRIAHLLIERVQLHDQGLDIHWREDGWRGLGPEIAAHPLVEEAASTARQLPPMRVQGFFNTWPEIRRTPWERMSRDDEPPPRFPPSPEAIDRMLETMRWIQWLELEQRHLVWMRAGRYPWREICRRFACDRTTAWRRWQRALGLVATRLNEAGAGEQASPAAFVANVPQLP